MNKKIKDLPKEVLADEAVRFISERHHATVKHVLEIYESAEEKGNPFPNGGNETLEENELQIIHDLIQLYEHDKISK